MKHGKFAKHLAKPATQAAKSKPSHKPPSLNENPKLHPSWEAKKQQTAQIQQFQGKKIIFETD